MSIQNSPSETAVFIAEGMTKTFPGVTALEDVRLSLSKGSIHALLGENGAGKSTLIKAITGVHRLDSGRMMLNGQLFEPSDTRDAISRGIGVVHQERNLIPRFSIGENIFLESLNAHPLRRIDYNQLFRDARVWLEMLGVDADPAMPVHRLSVAKTQLVEIAKALSLNSRILLLDEPTAALTPHETDTLFKILRQLRDDGVSLMFVSHKLEEVQEICDRVTVLRDGKNACESQPLEGLDRQAIVRLMIGRNEQIPDWSARDRSTGKALLQLKNVSTSLGHKEIDLSVHKGEIVGLSKAGTSFVTFFRFFFSTLSIRPTFPSALRTASSKRAILSILALFHSLFAASLFAIKRVVDVHSSSIIFKLFARNEEPVSVISTIASASLGGFTSVAPQLNSTLALIPFSAKYFFVIPTASVEMRFPSRSSGF